MQRSLSRIGSVALIVALAAGFVATFRYISSPHADVHNQAIGANVTVTGSEVPKTIQAVAAADAQQNLPAEIQPLTSAVRITPSGALPAPLTLDFKLSSRVSGDDIVLVETRETPSSPWTLVQSAISPDGWHASVRTAHLSDWRAWLVKAGAVISFLRDHLLNGLTGDLTTEASPPQCANDYYSVPESQHDDYTIGWLSKFGGNPLYWCFGEEDGQRILKIVNRMRYPLEISHPGFTFLRDGGLKFSLDQLARLGAGQDTILFPFEEAVYAVNLP